MSLLHQTTYISAWQITWQDHLDMEAFLCQFKKNKKIQIKMFGLLS